jgi:A118 family predicted phage portal protein
MDRLRKYYRKQGYKFAEEDYYSYIDKWNQWYQGKVVDFHDYTIYNGIEEVKVDMRRLCMAKKICEDKAGFIINDRLEFNVTNNQEIVDEVLKDNDFMVEGSQLLEKANALGTGAFVEFVDTNGNVVIDYVGAYNIIPLCAGNENKINQIAIVSKIDDKSYYISEHTLISDISRKEFGQWVVQNYKTEVNDDCDALIPIELTEEEVESGVYTPYLSPVPLFQLIKPNIANNIEINSKMGISVFANALDQLKACDMTYDAYIEEIQNGKSRLFVNEEMATIQFDENGQPQQYFNRKDTLFYSMKMGKDAKDKIIHDTPALRTTELSNAICDMLSMLSFKVNLGNDYYNFKDGKVEKTATEVISEDSDLYRQVKKDELIIESALVGMIKAILYLRGLDINDEINIKFDDSIVIDDSQLMKDALLELNSGVIDRIEYYQRVYKMSEEEAIELDRKIEGRKPKEDPTELIANE